MFYTYTGRKTASKGGYNTKGGGRYNSVLPRKPLEQLPQALEDRKEPECQEFKCVSTWKPPAFGFPTTKPCPAATCPPGYRVIYDPGDMGKSGSCPKYDCRPPPPKDAVCNVTGKTFGTFDGTQFKYDVCEHVLARDVANDDWDVVLSKRCNDDGSKVVCVRDLIVRHADELVKMFPDLSMEYNGYR